MLKIDIESGLRDVDASLRQWRSSTAPGLAVGISVGWKTVYGCGFGMADPYAGIANETCTRMRIGSTTKQFACLLALLLAESDSLDIDAPVRCYIPELSGVGGNPTLRQLMNHTGGTRDYLDLQCLTLGLTVPPIGEALRTQVRQAHVNFPPGERMLYCNGGYHLLSIALERFSGQSFERLLIDRIFAPAGMHDTSCVVSDRHADAARAVQAVKLPDGTFQPGTYPSDELRGEGGVVSTVDDLLRWTSNFDPTDKHRIGSSQAWKALMTEPTYASGFVGRYMLGLINERYRGIDVVSHAGGVVGGGCEMLVVPEAGLSIVVLANRSDIDPRRIARGILDCLCSELLGPVRRAVPAMGNEHLLGDYYSEETGQLYTVRETGDRLGISLCRSPGGLALYQCSDNSFDVEFGVTGHTSLEVRSDGQLDVSVDGAIHSYRRLPIEPEHPRSWFEAAQGHYVSADAAAEVDLERSADEYLFSSRSAYGGRISRLIPISATLAELVWSVPAASQHGVVELHYRGSVIVGLWINTERTTKLYFARTQSDGR